MALSIKTRFRIRVLTVVTAVCALIGAITQWRSIDNVTPAIGGALVVGLIGASVCYFEMALQDRLRRMSLAAALALRLIAYLAIVLMVGKLVRLVTGLPYETSSSDIWGTLALTFGFNFLFVLRRQFGTTNLIALVTGRYRQPQQEERAVLFLDLAGSTGTAERLGDVRFHAFLDTLFTDMTDAILDRGGEIYRYIGDEVIVTWQVPSLLKSARRRHDVLDCFFAIRDALAANRSRYEATFGTSPHFRGALHVGPLVVGEMGDFKREIVLLGDLMNTTSRIESLCRDLGKDYLVSAAAHDLLAGGGMEDLHFEDLGPVRIRGKRISIHLFAASDKPTATSTLAEAAKTYPTTAETSGVTTPEKVD
ncbi:Adenylate cyclase [Hyphomicrobiales bacterium]|nr:Adenylate cyclase [Hyphomicrobiales bacterium]CAH1664392.1 Adenylate cyclase [Hyphomicrobiales bacterium]